jgi:hypothetical protein
VLIKSQRAIDLLKSPQAIVNPDTSQMRKYPSDELNLWVKIERDNQNVKKLSFAGILADHEKVLLEAVAALMKGRPLTHLENLSFRECEAFLRDRNSEMALENVPANDEGKFKKFFTWLKVVPLETPAQDYQFSSERGPFSKLKLVDKIRELKAFLSSFEVRELYRGVVSPELVDVDDLTVYIQAPYQSERDRALFEELHILGVSIFQEENLNFIPES